MRLRNRKTYIKTDGKAGIGNSIGMGNTLAFSIFSIFSAISMLHRLRTAGSAGCAVALMLLSAWLLVACDLSGGGIDQTGQTTDHAAGSQPAAGHFADGRRVAVTVGRVTDGDTVWVYTSDPEHSVKVRLLDIDAPERCQDWGKESGQALRDKIQGRTLDMLPDGADRYRRVLAVLYLDGEDINAWLVEQGHAWAGRWRGEVQNYDWQEWQAQRARRGLWSLPGEPMYPRDFRRSGVQCN